MQDIRESSKEGLERVRSISEEGKAVPEAEQRVGSEDVSYERSC